ncbi:peptide chain release factor N(5)-glutamine methyltransferase [uncultured Victivallis sp.]|uniref:peptide chain release factor N(5)-glutamine methyltransferase n=1 Tax=uncultured Victivallis sp. TaxID=354118 RepID=UPI0025DDF707|nr:peptide chain release factor N(5)-glutamine methyltransferase [uncultured Victivallis sp.]
MSRYFELRRELHEKFAAAGIESAGVDADILIAELAGIDRCELFLRADTEVPKELERRIRSLAARRAQREPLQYLLGYAYFMDIRLDVSPEVLIPRPETERLVEWVVEQLPPGGTLLDLGTGSGAIALAAAHERSDFAVTAVDVSPEALALAMHNGEQLGLSARVRFFESDLFDALEGERFDLIAANLPYVTDEEYETLEPEVRCHEPRLALTAADAGFDLIRRAACAAPHHLKPGGQIIFELSPPQAPRLAELLAASRAWSRIAVLRDYTRRERFITAQTITPEKEK